MSHDIRYYISDEDVLLTARQIPGGHLIKETVVVSGATGDYGVIRQASREVTREEAAKFLTDEYGKTMIEANSLLISAEGKWQ